MNDIEIPQFLPTEYFRECADEDGAMTKYKIPTHKKSYTVGYEQALKDVGPLVQMAIDSLKYCENKYGHDNMVRLNLEAGFQSIKGGCHNV